jgi:23S rRNA-/tRNA-specific pseudouridylate synthase
MPSSCSSPTYIRAGGFRHVVPYAYEWRTRTKGRWVGRALLDVLADEFRGYSRAYFAAALEGGAISVNGRPARAGDLVRGTQDEVGHVAHRHEPPVVDAPIRVVRHAYPPSTPTTSSSPSSSHPPAILAVDKPPSWPVHPTGGFQKNTLTFALECGDGVVGWQPPLGGVKRGREEEEEEEEEEEGATRTGSAEDDGPPPPPPLHVLYRIDRLVSGLVLFATDSALAAEFLERLRGADVRKVYLARVAGRIRGAAEEGVGDAAAPPGSVARGVTAAPVDGGWTGVRDMLLGGGSDEHVRRVVDPLVESSGRTGGQGVGEGALPPGLGVLLAPVLLTIARPIAEIPGKHGRFISLDPQQGGAGAAAAGTSTPSAPTATPPPPPRQPKPATTQVIPVAYDARTDTTCVLAFPITGRTHQLRVHLRDIGHPIANDPTYGGGGDDAGGGGGAGRGSGGARLARDTIPRLAAAEALPRLAAELQSQRSALAAATTSGEDGAQPSLAASVLDRCPHCAAFWELHAGRGAATGGGAVEAGGMPPQGVAGGADGEGEGEGESPFQARIWLHALAYTGQGFSFSVPPPAWWWGV